MYEYDQETGMYSFYLNGSLQFEAQEIAILFDFESNTIISHGDADKVELQLEQINMAANLHPEISHHSESIILICDEFKEDDLNAMLEDNTKAGVMYTKMKMKAEKIARNLISKHSLV